MSMRDFDVFLSYIREDRELLGDLYIRLKLFGFRCWMDTRELKGGDIWEPEIEEVLASTNVFLACVSSRWAEARSYVHRELELAEKRRRSSSLPSIVPLLLDNSELPPALSGYHWIDLNDKQKAFPSLLEYLNKNVAVPQPRPLSPFVASVNYVVDFDDWTLAGSRGPLGELLTFFARGETTKRSQWLYHSGQYQSVIELWSPVTGNAFFDVNHPSWNDLSRFLGELLPARVDLAYSHFALASELSSLDDLLAEIGKGIRIAIEIVSWRRPHAEPEPSPNDLMFDGLVKRFLINVLALDEHWNLPSWSEEIGMQEAKIHDFLNRCRDRLEELKDAP
jgi:hypothetical protein